MADGVLEGVPECSLLSPRPCTELRCYSSRGEGREPCQQDTAGTEGAGPRHKSKWESGSTLMTGVFPGTKEETEMFMPEDLLPGSHGQSQEHLVIAEHGSRSLGVSPRQQKLGSKAPGSAAGQPVWNMTATRPKKGTQLPMPRISREPVHGDVHPQEHPGGFQGMRFHYERNSEADIIAEMGPKEPNGLEMELMRRQLREINGRLCALEDQAAISRQREAVFLTMVLSACIANLWLWMRQ
ncbi:fetal and adult testis-expressed transcript protein isoform X2 [Artibeus jamaicensis]|uniref:fetal and adult testis-expressed transcript protein isoform X2 n=1 Tax=Artibeus jamaicensis TaxID=9417 RepID=UPI00235A946D|nr:fetal and adult testis-expressed transcript protein isoform X2 [Artibeus jamaicensis]